MNVKPKRNADCHPNRPHLARGMCAQCYAREHSRRRREDRPRTRRSSATAPPHCWSCGENDALAFRPRYPSKCRACLAAAGRDYRSHHADELRQRKADWYLRTREFRRERDRTYRKTHRQEIDARVRRWATANRERHLLLRRVIASRRRARLAGSGGRHSVAQWLAVVEKQSGRCVYCGQGAKLERDHVVPIARGGSDDISNIVGACRSCNARKWARTEIAA